MAHPASNMDVLRQTQYPATTTTTSLCHHLLPFIFFCLQVVKFLHFITHHMTKQD